MKAASKALIDFLANLSENEPDASVFVFDLYDFLLTDGTVFLWSSGDVPITIPQGPIAGAVLAGGGTGYTVGETYIVNAGDNNAIIQITGVVPGTNAASSFIVFGNSTTSKVNPGTNYQVWSGVGVYPGGPNPGFGLGMTINITAVTGTVTYDVLSPANQSLPTISRSKVNSSIGLSVDDLIVTIAATPLTQINGNTLLAALVNGYFDGATVTVSRLVMPSPGDVSLGTVVWFRGTVGDITDISKIGAKFTIKALTEYLNIQMPKNLYQPSCRWTLFDVGCTLIKDNFAVQGVVTNTPNAPTTITFGTNLTQPGPIAAPTITPTLGYAKIPNINLAASTYYVVVTYVTPLGETGPSPEASASIGITALGISTSPTSTTTIPGASPNTNNVYVLGVFLPPAPAGVVGYNVYVGQTEGEWQLQSESPVAGFGAYSGQFQTTNNDDPFYGTVTTLSPPPQNSPTGSAGVSWMELSTGLVQGPPPPSNTTGYFTQGTITFTSGMNQGLSRFVTQYTNPNGSGGIVTIIDALPVAPVAGDKFVIYPGCDRSQTSCRYKFFNINNFGGFPFLPAPESSI